MTTMTTNYDLGQKLFTVEKDDLRIIEFEVKKISLIKKADGGEKTYLYSDSGTWTRGYDAESCFESMEALLAYMQRPTTTDEKEG